MGKILLTGAGGYIGKRLLPILIEEGGHHVVALVRSKSRFSFPEHLDDHVTVVEADLLERDSLDAIPHDIDYAYYLVHSMSQNSKDFEKLEQTCAHHFVDRLKQTNAKQLIYLSGLASDESLSRHLESRKNVEDYFLNSGFPSTVFRAGIIIGSGSASFEIIRDLVEKLPVMIAPKWVSSQCQPISIFDVIYYLSNILGKEEAFHRSFDIGGPDQLTYKQMLYGLAKVRNLKRWIISVPVLTPKLSSYWLYFVTSTNFTLAYNLVDSLKNDAVCKEETIDQILPHQCLDYETSLERVFSVIEQNAVISSWRDTLVGSRLHPHLKEYIEVPKEGCFKDETEVEIQGNVLDVIERIWRIGGRNGWYSMDFAWKIRGWIDQLFQGVGLTRGRTHPTRLSAGDTLDFWRVILADKENGHLLLYAEMRLPGEAWLEFKVESEGTRPTLLQTATFRPKGVWGRLYWYSLFLFHVFIFKRMAISIARGS